MAYKYVKRADNVYLLDTKMFGFGCFNAAYIVTGEEVALIDTGVSSSLEDVRAAIKERGFSIKDFSYIFVTHAEHPDHGGNVGAFLKENSRAKVYVAPGGIEYLTNPEIEAAKRRANLSAHMAARFGEMVPVPQERIQALKDGDTFEIGNGERLKVMVAPGHQPSGIVILAEKNNGLFINDLAGAYFADAGASWVFTPFRADVKQSVASLQKVMPLNPSKLYLGHFGICDRPTEVMRNALKKMQELLDIGKDCKNERDPQEIMERAMAIRMPEAEKIKATREPELYEYLSQELIPSMSRAYADYFIKEVAGH